MMYHHLHQAGMHLGPGLWLGLGLQLVFWVALIALIVLLVRALTHRHQVAVAGADPALERLRMRLAAGEISGDEYERLRTTLGKP